MVHQSRKTVFLLYTSIIVSACFVIFTSSLFAGKLNNNEEFFSILSTEIPKKRDIIYISETYSDVSMGKGQPITTIKAMKKNGDDSVPIIEGKSIFSIQVSPDKSKLLLIAPDHSPEKDANTDWLNSHIWLYSEGKLNQLTSGKIMDSDPVWSQSGDKIYFTRSKIIVDIIGSMLTATESNVWVMNADGSKPLQLTSAQKNIVNSSPAPIKDSKKVLFTTNRNTKWQIFIMDEDGSNQKSFINNGMLGNWSPDGKFLAYMDSSPGNIYLANRDGQLIRRLTEKGDVDFSPTWSPDSQYLTYSRINAAHFSPPPPKDTHFPEDGHDHKDEHFSENIPKSFLREEPYADIWKLSINKKEAPKRLTYEGLNNNFPHWITTSPE